MKYNGDIYFHHVQVTCNFNSYKLDNSTTQVAYIHRIINVDCKIQ